MELLKLRLHLRLLTSQELVAVNDTKYFVSHNDSQSENTNLVIGPDDMFMKHVPVDSNV